MVAGVVLVAVDHLVGGDDGDPGKGASHGTCLENPVPLNLPRPLAEPQDGGGPGREEEDGLSH